MAVFLNIAINQLQKYNQVGNLNITRETIAYNPERLPDCFDTT